MRRPSSGMKRFVLRCLLAMSPVLAVVALYVIKDPFHVVKPYRGKIYNPGDTISLTVNWGIVSVESFKYFYPQYHFDSFIFGSSLSGYYRISDWQRHLPSGARPFHFNANRETLQGILNKLNYLTRQGVTINNALLVIEDEMLQRRPLDKDALYIQHPQTTTDVSWWQFHQLFFNTFRRPAIIAYTIWPQAMTRYVLEHRYATSEIINRDEHINEGTYHWADSVIEINPDLFYTPEHMTRYTRHPRLEPCPPKVTREVESLLRTISDVLNKQGTNYQVIIPPHYRYEAICDNDLYMMKKIFGADRVHDFSHDQRLASDLHYYYDSGHLIARECAVLMDSAYSSMPLQSPYMRHD